MPPCDSGNVKSGSGNTAEQVGPAAYLGRLLAEAREEVRRADSKASLVLAGLGVGLGALLGGLIAGNWAPSELSNSVEWLWWVGATFIVGALSVAAASVWPRFETPTGLPNKIHYWGDLANLEDIASLRSLLAADPPNEFDRDVEQFFILSKIVIRKYQLVRAALALGAGGSGMCGVAVFVDTIWF